MGADLNLAEAAHRNLGLSNWYSVFNEADDGGSPPTFNEHTVYGGEKIDFWSANGGSYDRVSGNAVTSGGRSDHSHPYGTFDG